MKETEFLNQTGTFGPTLEKRPFTEDEKIILLHFFTNIDKNIYAATDNMPSSLWALLEGGYSRSQLSMRMRFLNIFEEMQQELSQGKLSPENVISIKDFANQIRNNQNLNLSFFLKKAEQFMQKWAVQYGHDSLKDSDVVRFAIENVSQAIVPFIEEARLGAYQEKSTRYVEFSRSQLIVPTDLEEFEEDIREWNDLLITNYEESKPIVEKFIQKKMDRSTFASDAAFKRTVDAKTFDMIRYFLPATMLTSIGVVWPTREAERHISRLMSFFQQEVRSVGEALLEEGKKISPGLLNHVAQNKYQRERQEKMTQLRNEIATQLRTTEPEIGRKENDVKLLSISSHMDARIASSLLFRHNFGIHRYKEYLQLCLNNPLIITKTMSAYFEGRDKFDSIPLAAEVGNILFEISMDFGAYRDLKRHRRNLFLSALFTALGGYEYPEHVEKEPELAEIKTRIDLCAKKTTELHQLIYHQDHYLTMYIIMFAHKQRVLWQMDPRQLAYVVELRTTPAGHYSYRTICQDMFKVVQPYMSEFCKYIRVDMSKGEESRKKQEENTVEKLKKLGVDATRIS